MKNEKLIYVSLDFSPCPKTDVIIYKDYCKGCEHYHDFMTDAVKGTILCKYLDKN